MALLAFLSPYPTSTIFYNDCRYSLLILYGFSLHPLLSSTCNIEDSYRGWGLVKCWIEHRAQKNMTHKLWLIMQLKPLIWHGDIALFYNNLLCCNTVTVVHLPTWKLGIMKRVWHMFYTSFKVTVQMVEVILLSFILYLYTWGLSKEFGNLSNKLGRVLSCSRKCMKIFL